ncbi:MAG TPA: hypothetical protein VNA89_03155 [Gemmatimonadaceae bacterium]|nr:hypothetical protein [Gemmatimonadaceae bacterium]
MERFEGTNGDGVGTTAYGNGGTSGLGETGTSTMAPEQTLGSGRSSGVGTGGQSKMRGALDQAKSKAQDGWKWVRQNPWPVLGAVAGAGLLLAMGRRRGSSDYRLAHMDSERPVGRGRSGSGRTDEVTERMSEGRNY